MSFPGLMRSFGGPFLRVLPLLVVLLTAGQRAGAQVRERPVAFDSSGRVTAVTKGSYDHHQADNPQHLSVWLLLRYLIYSYVIFFLVFMKIDKLLLILFSMIFVT